MSATASRPSVPLTQWRTIAALVVSVVAVAAVVRWGSQQEAPTFPSSLADWSLLVVALAVYALATLIRAWRWHVILQLDGIEHERADALGLICVGYMGNTVLPARGGEVLRIVLLGQRTTARKREILGSIIAERALDALVLVALFVLLTFVGVAGSPTGALPALLALAGLVGLFFAVALYLRLRRRGKLESFAARVRPVVRASRPLVGRSGIKLALATALVWVLEAVIFVLVAKSLGLTMSIVEGLFLDVLASFFALIPAAPGYVGTFDAAIVFGLHALDIRGGVVLAFALLVRFILFVPITAVGLVLLLTRYGGLGMLRRERRDAGEQALA